MSVLEGYEYPIDDIHPLCELLKKWNLECLSKILLGKYTKLSLKICVDV